MQVTALVAFRGEIGRVRGGGGGDRGQWGWRVMGARQKTPKSD
jgi:hypothetical protein